MYVCIVYVKGGLLEFNFFYIFPQLTTCVLDCFCSDSSDSDQDEPQPYTIPAPLPREVPPKIPPKSPKLVSGGEKRHQAMEEIFISNSTQQSYLKSVHNNRESMKLSPPRVARRGSRSAEGSPVVGKKKIPPPKPPRTDIPLDYSSVEYGEQVEFFNSARRVSGLVDMDVSQLYQLDRKATTPNKDQKPFPPRDGSFQPPTGPVPVPSVVNRRIETATETEAKRVLTLGRSVDSALNKAPDSPKVLSLIKMFESKSPTSSPPLKYSPPFNPRKSPPISPKKYRKQPNNVPILPPKPQPPPIPPRPIIPAEGSDTPMPPPRTPAPVIPPKPQGSKPSLVHTHQRSLSDSQPLPPSEDRKPLEPLRTSPKLVPG